MIYTILESEERNFKWIDLVNPTPAEMDEIKVKYHLHATSLEDCLEPRHLPKIERIDGITFSILRAYDERASNEESTVNQLTRKVAVFCSEEFVITIHRAEMPYFTKFIADWKNEFSCQKCSTFKFLVFFINAVGETYLKPIEAKEKIIDGFEQDIFNDRTNSNLLRQIHVLKQSSTVIKKMLRMTLDILKKADNTVGKPDPFYQNAVEELESYYFIADEVVEDCSNILNLYLNISSHRTNEVMRVLTIFSLFFMPITFIAGVYGMNFEFMPEIHTKFGHDYGYLLTMSSMIIVTIIIYFFFKRKGWIRHD